MFGGFLTFLSYCALIAVITYLVPLFIVYLLPAQNLKKKYNAQWALVTGASSGLGRALAENLAKQGLSVVLVALDDQLLANAHKELTQKYPKQKFRKVGCNLGSDTKFMDKLIEATKDITVQVVFSNAGYLVIRAFAKTDINDVMNNFNCNTTSHIHVAHYYFKRMMEEKKPGCIVFSSSQAAFLPAPGNAVYGAGKACLTQLATNLAIEGSAYGIDVSVIQAGPMNTRFTDKVTKLDMLKTIYTLASPPEAVVEVLMKTVGRLSVRDHSLMTISIRLLLKIIDVNVFIKLISAVQPWTSDWKKHADVH